MVHEDYHDDPILGLRATAETVQNRINNRYDKLYYYDRRGDRYPYVCSVCDEQLIHEKDLSYFSFHNLKTYGDVLKWTSLNDEDRIPACEEHYRIRIDPHKKLDRPEHQFVRDMALSPRGIVGRISEHGNAAWGVSCCSRCTNALKNRTVPFYAIVNKNYVGCAPPELTSLTEIELAMLTPVHGRGYVVTYAGGRQQNLEGTLTFLKTDEEEIASSMMQLEGFGLGARMVVLLTGRMTSEQIRIVKEKAAAVCPDRLIRAVEWLVENNVRWKHVDLNQFRAKYRDKLPIVVDHSTEVASENANVETHQVFRCYMPDGTLDENFGGFSDPTKFKEHVDEMARQQFKITLHCPRTREFVNGGKENDLLVMTSLLQFPYGRMGQYESRETKDGSYTTDSHTEDYVKHLSRLSAPEFQKPMIQLIMYSILCKMKLLKRSCLQVKGKQKANQIATLLNQEDLTQTINQRHRGNRQGGTSAPRAFLKSVEACARALPHTDEFSKSARSEMETIQHHFGIPSIFLTVNFDDENSLILELLTGEDIDTDDKTPDELTDEECCNRQERRKLLRVKYPGFTATNYEMLLHILAEEVVGWDMRENRPTENEGFFGPCEAFLLAIEEQGRKTLHGHMTIWIKRFAEMRRRMFFGTQQERDLAFQHLVEYFDSLITTRLFAVDSHENAQREFRRIFDHECQVPILSRSIPQVTPNQNLRHFRHVHGYQYEEGVFSRCLHCDKNWTYEEMVNKFVRDRCDIPPPSGLFDIPITDFPKARLQSQVLEFQKTRDIDDVETETPVTAINALYNHHFSFHMKGTCFKCMKKKGGKGHAHGPECECRFRLPDLPRQSSTLTECNEELPWYDVRGNAVMQKVARFSPARKPYDLFQNVSCQPITESKFSCNTNISVITDGPVGIYQCKYQFKANNWDEATHYAGVSESMKRMFEDERGPRRHEDDTKEARRRLMRAVCAHNKKNIIGAPMAAYLIRNDSRFYFSHQVAQCPLKDLLSVAFDDPIASTAKYALDGSKFWENKALHYLCRHEKLDHLSPFEFFSEYEQCYVSMPRKLGKRRSGQDVRPLFDDSLQKGQYRAKYDSGYFKHPSSKVDNPTGTTWATQGVTVRKEAYLLKVPQWVFPDTRHFEADILTCTENRMNASMEAYAKNVLALFSNWRHIGDIRSDHNNFPFTHKYQEVYQEEQYLPDDERQVFKKKNLEFLQNIQNCAYNSLRYKDSSDDLADITEPLQVETGEEDDDPPDNSDDEDEEEDPFSAYDFFVDVIQVPDPDDLDESHLPAGMQGFTFSNLRNKGTFKCGYDKSIQTPTTILEENEVMPDDFVQHAGQTNTPGQNARWADPGPQERRTVRQIVDVYLHRTESRARANVFHHNPQQSVRQANGTVRSILEWARAAKLDSAQQRAFEAITAAFLLTFYQDCDNNEALQEATHHEKSVFRKMGQRLRKLRGNQSNEDQLVCLLHGPGGSGKSTVINLVKAYAEEYCELIGHTYTSRTIVVTALSGVAATLLNGETTHSALGLAKKRITEKMIEEWSDTRLVIIDEISFGSARLLEKVDLCLGMLKKKRYSVYGGLNVVLAGDYSQLEPPGAGDDAVYKDGNRVPELHDSLNCYIELNGMHRFKDDLEFGHMMLRFRSGNPTLDDIDRLNSECFIGESGRTPSGNVQVATYHNKDRDAVNAAIFDKYCKENGVANGPVFNGAVLVLMDNLFVKNNSDKMVAVRSNSIKRYFYEHCGEDDCRVPRSDKKGKRVDPVLKLYYRCPLMLTENHDVPNAQANGSRVMLERINVKPGEQPFLVKLDSGVTIRAFFVSQVKSLRVRHEDKGVSPPVFESMPKNHNFFTHIKVDNHKEQIKMAGNQFCFVSNSCTTGHKLQGYTAKQLFVNAWNYTQNWPYVVLSRVTTMKGLFFRKRLTRDTTKFSMPPRMLQMIQYFRQTFPVRVVPEETYDQLVNAEIADAARLGGLINNNN